VYPHLLPPAVMHSASLRAVQPFAPQPAPLEKRVTGIAGGDGGGEGGCGGDEGDGGDGSCASEGEQRLASKSKAVRGRITDDTEMKPSIFENWEVRSCAPPIGMALVSPGCSDL